jgi:predicted DNA-binding protein (MmcQ/YjbR family)
VQWGGADVWKIGGKVFAIIGWDAGDEPAITFKCSPESFDILREQPGLRPAPYLASRGMTWIQRTTDETLSDADLELYVRQSYMLASQNLTRKLRTALGLADPPGTGKQRQHTSL